MKLICFVLLAGLAAYAQAASTGSPATSVPVATTPTTPTSACAGCLGTADIDARFNKFNFSGGCSVYKQAYDCSVKCQGVQASLTSYVGDMCVPTMGIVSQCGQKVKNCVTDLMNANAAAVSKQQKTLCSDITAFFQCSNDALVQCQGKNTSAVISQLTASVSELDMESGCNGQCAAGVGQCMAGLTRDVTSTGSMNATMFKNMCQQLGSAPVCIGALKSTICANTQTGITLADNYISKAKTQLSDLCDSVGNPTPCATGFISCGQQLKTITASNGCQVMSSYLTCAERLPCKYSIEDNIKAEIKNITAAETMSGCANVGGCADRIKQCVTKATSLLATVDPSTNITSFCSISQTVEQCFTVVRQDPNCKYENLEASDDETKFFQMFGSQCGNATECSQSVTQCKTDYAGIDPKANMTTKCVIVEHAVECITQMLNSDMCVRVGQKAHDDDKALVSVFTKDCGDPSLCDQGIKACYQPIVSHNIITDPDSKKVTDCPIINTAVTCMDDMAASETCKIFQKKIDSVEGAIRSLDSGFCNTASSCDTSINACKADYANLDPNADKITKCTAVGKAVTCINLQLQAPICVQAGKQANADGQALATEYNTTCGNPTLCDSELNSCFKPIIAKIGQNLTTAQDCPDIKTAVKCINTISNAWACKVEGQDMAGAAAQITAQDASLCASGVSVQASILLIAFGILSHFFKKF